MNVRAYDEGSGPGVLLLHGGMGDGSSLARVASRLTPRFRVIRPHRLQYRLDLKRGRACTMAEEVRYVRELVEPIGEPLVVVGHSSGAVLALETLVALPSAFAGAVIYEPPLVAAGLPLGGEALVRAQAAVARGQSGKALAIFLREIVRIPAWAAWLAGMTVPVVPSLRRYAHTRSTTARRSRNWATGSTRTPGSPCPPSCSAATTARHTWANDWTRWNACCRKPNAC